MSGHGLQRVTVVRWTGDGDVPTPGWAVSAGAPWAVCRLSRSRGWSIMHRPTGLLWGGPDPRQPQPERLADVAPMLVALADAGASHGRADPPHRLIEAAKAALRDWAAQAGPSA